MVSYTLMVIYLNFFFVCCIWLYPPASDTYNFNSHVWIIFIALAFITWVAAIVFTVTNIKNAFWLYTNGKYSFLKKYMSMLKLGAVPYFILNFLFCAGLAFLVVASSRGFIIFSPIPILFVIPIFLTYGT